VIHSYSALINLGLLLGAALALWEARRREVEVRPVVDAALAAAVGGLILARAAYVGAHWDYYAHHPREALRPWKGGLLWQGALVGGVLGTIAVGAVRRRWAGTLLDVLTPGAAALAALAWLACFMVGCAYGIETYPVEGLLWRLSLDLPDLYGIRQPRVAVQLLGAGWSALLAMVTLVAARRLPRAGATFALWLALQSLGAFGLGFLRADEMASVMGWRVDQLANLALGVVGVVVFCARMIGARRGANHQ